MQNTRAHDKCENSLIDKKYLQKTEREILAFNNELCKLRYTLDKKIATDKKKKISLNENEKSQLKLAIEKHKQFKVIFDESWKMIKVMRRMNDVHESCRGFERFSKSNLKAPCVARTDAEKAKTKKTSQCASTRFYDTDDQNISKGLFYNVDNLDFIFSKLLAFDNQLEVIWFMRLDETTPLRLVTELTEDLQLYNINLKSFSFHVLNFSSLMNKWMSANCEKSWAELDNQTKVRFKLIHQWLNDENRIDNLLAKDVNCVAFTKTKPLEEEYDEFVGDEFIDMKIDF